MGYFKFKLQWILFNTIRKASSYVTYIKEQSSNIDHHVARVFLSAGERDEVSRIEW